MAGRLDEFPLLRATTAEWYGLGGASEAAGQAASVPAQAAPAEQPAKPRLTASGALKQRHQVYLAEARQLKRQLASLKAEQDRMDRAGPPGIKLVLVGPPQVGKSWLAAALAGQPPPTEPAAGPSAVRLELGNNWFRPVALELWDTSEQPAGLRRMACAGCTVLLLAYSMCEPVVLEQLERFVTEATPDGGQRPVVLLVGTRHDQWVKRPASSWVDGWAAAVRLGAAGFCCTSGQTRYGVLPEWRGNDSRDKLGPEPQCLEQLLTAIADNIQRRRPVPKLVDPSWFQSAEPPPIERSELEVITQSSPAGWFVGEPVARLPLPPSLSTAQQAAVVKLFGLLAQNEAIPQARFQWLIQRDGQLTQSALSGALSQFPLISLATWQRGWAALLAGSGPESFDNDLRRVAQLLESPKPSSHTESGVPPRTQQQLVEVTASCVKPGKSETQQSAEPLMASKAMSLPNPAHSSPKPTAIKPEDPTVPGASSAQHAVTPGWRSRPQHQFLDQPTHKAASKPSIKTLAQTAVAIDRMSQQAGVVPATIAGGSRSTGYRAKVEAAKQRLGQQAQQTQQAQRTPKQRVSHGELPTVKPGSLPLQERGDQTEARARWSWQCAKCSFTNHALDEHCAMCGAPVGSPKKAPEDNGDPYAAVKRSPALGPQHWDISSELRSHAEKHNRLDSSKSPKAEEVFEKVEPIAELEHDVQDQEMLDSSPPNQVLDLQQLPNEPTVRTNTNVSGQKWKLANYV